MTKDERDELRQAIKLLVDDDDDAGKNGGWHTGIRVLHKLAGYDVSAFDIVLEPLDTKKFLVKKLLEGTR